MSGPDVNRLVFSFIQFLESQLQSSHLSADAAESVEVAIQCLESAYGIDTSNEALVSQLRIGAPLLEVFNAAVKTNQESTASGGHSQPTVTITRDKIPEKQEITQEDRSKAEVLKVKGNNCMKSEQYSDALECYTQAISLDDCNAVYYCNRAAAYSKLEKHKQAIEDCTKALEIDPTYSKAYGRMGLAFTSLNEHEKARDAYKRATDLEPDNASYMTNLKIAEQKLRETSLGAGGLGGGFGAFGGGGPGAGAGGMPDIGALLNNPALMNMASNMMQNPQMQNLMQNMLSGAMQPQPGAAPGGGGGAGETASMANLLQAGQQLAQQVQQTNPELVDQLRQQLSTPEGTPKPDDNEGSEEK